MTVTDTTSATPETESETETEAAEQTAPQATESELFRQSEIAADYVEGLLDVLDYDGDIDELVQNGRPVVEVLGGRLQPLVGQRGATLEALQELTRLAIFRQTGTPSRLLLDVGGDRAARRKEMGAIAKKAAEKGEEDGEPGRLGAEFALERQGGHQGDQRVRRGGGEGRGGRPPPGWE